jgi:iron(II)-dependent oxidoreductase
MTAPTQLSPASYAPPPAPAGARSADAASLAALLVEARARTLELISTVSEEDLRRQHDPLMSPVLWDLGHIAHFEELWLLRNTEGPVEFGEMPGIYNPFEHPRATRDALPIPALPVLLARMADIRARVLDRLPSLDPRGNNPLFRDGYVVRMVAQHEYQHNETILQTLQLKQGAPYAPPRRVETPRPPSSPLTRGMVRFPGGEVELGTDDRSAAYDNERPRHRLTIPPFRIDVAPATNGEYRDFLDDGGCRRRELWSPAGWAWLRESGVRAPRGWLLRDAIWMTRSMDRVEPLHPDKPVCHISFHEAEAFARWAGKRLPTEFEWEVAAGWDPATGFCRSYPWGDEPPTAAHANLDQLSFDTAPAGAYPLNVSPLGCVGMIGDVWEWTSSDFTGYPGFTAFPYRDYSEVFFGSEYKVLRGGSWATRPGAIRNTFRNWDYPIRRQIFSGVRCARDD